jgi:membrane protein implicated in regulation of membrane protease activity
VTHVPPVSSLIFVVILAVWAVYLVQHWVRRRDHLATARSVDRFSEAMRVLERRRALPRPDLAEAAPRAYTVSPLRPARPQVVVKRGPAGATAAPVAARLDPSRPGATAVGPTTAYRRARSAARLRATALLLGSLTLVTLVALSSTGVLPLWWAYVGIGALAASVLAVRHSVARTRARSRRSHRPAARPARPAQAEGRQPARQQAARPGRRPATAARPASPARPASVLPTSGRPAAAQPASPAGPATPQHAFARQSLAVTTRTARRSVSPAALYDIVEVEAALDPRPGTAGATADADRAHLARAGGYEQPTSDPRGARPGDEADGTWEPVPVPPPTYTLKARAGRGGQAPTGSAELPADGAVMALDEEFEDLPHVDRVG